MSDASAFERTELTTHAALVIEAVRWLRRQNCGVVFQERFRAMTSSGEQPDAIGWRHSVSILVECKVSRADFLADKRKAFRRDCGKGMGDWRFFMCPPKLISPEELPPGWGLLYADAGRVRAIAGVPPNTGWHAQRPFNGDKACEMQMFYAALRRMEIRGHLAAVYDPAPTGIPVA